MEATLAIVRSLRGLSCEEHLRGRPIQLGLGMLHLILGCRGRLLDIVGLGGIPFMRLVREILSDLRLVYPISGVALPLAVNVLVLPLQVPCEIFPSHMLVAVLARDIHRCCLWGRRFCSIHLVCVSLYL